MLAWAAVHHALDMQGKVQTLVLGNRAAIGPRRTRCNLLGALVGIGVLLHHRDSQLAVTGLGSGIGHIGHDNTLSEELKMDHKTVIGNCCLVQINIEMLFNDIERAAYDLGHRRRRLYAHTTHLGVDEVHGDESCLLLRKRDVEGTIDKGDGGLGTFELIGVHHTDLIVQAVIEGLPRKGSLDSKVNMIRQCKIDPVIEIPAETQFGMLDNRPRRLEVLFGNR